MKGTLFFLSLITLSFASLQADPDLTGTWVAEVAYNQDFDTYKISFSPDGRCTVTVSNRHAEQETAGTWSWDGSLFRLNALFRNAKIGYLQQIQWVSVLNVSPDRKSFTILGKTAANSSTARITFFKSPLDPEKALPQGLTQHIPLGSRVALVGITAEDPKEAAFYLQELTVQLFNPRKYTLVDRNDIDQVLIEQRFQMSPYADEKFFVSIGQFLGATVVITGSINETGSQKRLFLKAIDVSTLEILGMVSIPL